MVKADTAQSIVFTEQTAVTVGRSGLTLVSAGRQSYADGEATVREEGLPGLACVYMNSGTMHYQTTCGEWMLTANSLMWLLPDVYHNYQRQGRVDETWFVFDGPVIELLRERGAAPESAPVLEHCSQLIRNCIARAWHHCQQSQEHSAQQELAAHTLHELLLLDITQREEIIGSEDPLIVLVKKQLAEHLYVSPKSVANHFHLTYATLRRQFKERVGCTMSAYQTRCRLQQACDLLINTTDSIADIGACCGYDDPLYFSRQFSKQFGVSPRSYRQNSIVL